MTDILTAGGNGTDGQLTILGADGKPLVHVQAPTTNPRRHDAELAIGGNGRNGLLRVKRADEGSQTTISDSGMSLYGHLSIYNKENKNPVNVNPFGDDVRVLLGDTGVAGYVHLSNGNNGPGPIIELDGKANALRFGNPGSDTSMIDILGQDATVRVGGESRNGRVIVQSGDGNTRAALSATDASLRLGGNGANGKVSVRGADGKPLLELVSSDNECTMGLGQANRPGRISIYNGNRQPALQLDGASGDIVMANADCAEEFDLVEDEVEPGTVMIFSKDGPLVVSHKPYDTRVAGVVSGAGSYRPALVLDRRDTGRTRVPIALMGKVFCKAEADSSPIAVGDMLTTSPRCGHAMRIADSGQAFGAMLGKALAPLMGGTGLIPILVTLR